MHSHFQIRLRGVLGVVRKSKGTPYFSVLLRFYDQVFEVFWGVHEVPPSPQKDNVCYLRIYTQIEPRRTHLNFEALKLQKKFNFKMAKPKNEFILKFFLTYKSNVAKI